MMKNLSFKELWEYLEERAKTTKGWHISIRGEPEEILRALKGIIPKGRILEVGARGGRLQKLCDSLKYDYAGVEFSEAMVEGNDALLPVRKPSDLPEGPFDCVVLNTTICMLSRKAAKSLVNEATARLKENGVLIQVDPKAKRLFTLPDGNMIEVTAFSEPHVIIHRKKEKDARSSRRR